MLAYIFLWLFDCLLIGKLGKMQTCMIESKHVSILLFCCFTLVMHFIFIFFFVRPKSCMLDNRFVFY